jgi:hypothetical protein
MIKTNLSKKEVQKKYSIYDEKIKIKKLYKN